MQIALFLYLTIFNPNLNNNFFKTRIKIQQPSTQFTLDIQYGGDPFDKYDLKGQTDYNKFIQAFDAFPWQNEIEKANRNPDGCSPTLSVKYKENIKSLWISMSGDKKDYGYLLGFVHFKSIKGKNVKWLEIYLPDDKETVKKLFFLFFNREFDHLEKDLTRLELFKEMESKN
jgi:hypothetical protein